MKHILKYRLKAMLRNRTMMFWSFIFPLALMTMFGLVLRSSYTYSKFDTVNIAIVENQAWKDNPTLQNILKETKSGDTPLFKTKVTSLDEAKKLLENEKVSSYIVCGDDYKVYIRENGLEQTITKTFFDEYLQKSSMIQNLMMRGASMEKIQEIFTTTNDYIETKSDENSNMTNIYFYTGLAMSAMFGGMWAVKAIVDIQADQSQKGARISMAPTNKAVHLFCALLLNLVSVFIILTIQFLYIYYMFDVNFNSQLPYLFLVLLVGDVAGSAMGSLIGSVVNLKKPEDKVNLVSSVTMLGSFLAGMMIVQLKWIIHYYAPFINYINPVSMITDAMYTLYYYGVDDRYYFNIICLIVFSVICYAISFISLSKKQYKSVGVM